MQPQGMEQAAMTSDKDWTALLLLSLSPRRARSGSLLHREDRNRNSQAHHSRRMYNLGSYRLDHGHHWWIQGLQRPSSHQQVIRS